MPERRFDGEFRTPTLGVTQKPIPIIGAGHCTCTDAGLVVEGRAMARGRAALLAVVAGTAGAGGAYLLKLLLFPDLSVGAIVGAGALGLFSAALAPAKEAEGKEPVEFTIPWDCVRKVEGDKEQQELVFLVVADNDPKGALYFAPQGDRDDFLVEIADRADIPIG